MSDRVTLTVTQGQLKGQEYVFGDRTWCLIGRASDCLLQLPNDLAHGDVSRHHCLLNINPPEVRVRDFGSRNGTYVNGTKIGQRAPRQAPEEAALTELPEVVLHNGDEIRLGTTVLRVSIPGL